ncbi:MAG: hypothetical protein OXF41_12925 [bacterium]|nr:hypothetical protein [bacterium]
MRNRVSSIPRVGIDNVMACGDLLGAIVETFVIAPHLQARSAVSVTRYRLSHLRERDPESPERQAKNQPTGAEQGPRLRTIMW